MPDVEFGQLRNRGNRLDVLVSQPVARVGFDPVLGGECGHVGQAPEFVGDSIARRMGIFTCVELYHGSLQHHRRFDLALVRRNEQADADPGIAEALDHRVKPVVLPGGIEPALGGALLAPFGDDASGVRLVAQRNRQHFLGRSHFQVERQIGRGLDPGQVLVADMAAVFAQVRSDPIAAASSNDLRRADRIGMIPAARVTDRGDVIDVHAKAEAGHRHGFARLPGFTASLLASSGGSSSAA